MVHAQTARRMTPRRRAQRQRKQLQRLLGRLGQPMTEAERWRILEVCVISLPELAERRRVMGARVWRR